MPKIVRTPEHLRLEEAREGKKWRRWGTYLSERQWGSVREDYSASGDAWNYFPFDHAHLRDAARRATKQEREPELEDTGVFADEQYFDVEVEYAKGGCEDVLVRFTVTNRGERARIVVLPQLWFRNTWSWGDETPKPAMY